MGNRQIEAYKASQQAKMSETTSSTTTGAARPPAQGSVSELEAKAFLDDLEKNRKEWRDSALAFLQGTHTRLGAKGFVTQLPADVLSQIVFLLRPRTLLLATCCPAGYVRVWDLSYTRVVHMFATNPGAYHVKLTDNEVICGLQRGIEIWDMWQCNKRDASRTPSIPGTGWAVDVGGDTLATAHTDRTFTVWDMRCERPPREPVTCADWIHCICVMSACDVVLCGLRNGDIEVWSVTGRDLVKKGRMQGHTDSVTCLQALSSYAAHKHLVMSGSYDATLRLWDIDNLTCVRTFSGHTQGVLSLCVRGNMLVSGAGEGVRVWDLSTGDLMHKMVHEEALCVQVLDETKVVSGGADANIKIWDVETGDEVISMNNKGHVFYMQVIYV
ncbi:hypothetical protein Pelo_8953 [Pelomyxa schiedti]|nr:hypothetical protein Pelo_8953 [Pelomyxa schiedti]